jgi:alpha-beta hydrolase superfamily lysophospholipase
VQTQSRSEKGSAEVAGYFEVAGAHLYTVLHQVVVPRARVLLVGAFASERHNSYLPWIRWARYLAARQIEVLRFDYRGIGESTGLFDEMTFDIWSEDLCLLAEWLKAQSPTVPLLLHGLELGAVLAGRAFAVGIADSLLLWSPPANANLALRSTLLRWVALEQIFKVGDERKTASQYIRQLEQNTFLEVEGYAWSGRLWRDSFAFELPSALSSEESAKAAYQRPVRIVKLGKDATPLIKGGFVGYDEFKDFTPLFAENLDWISATLDSFGGGRP